MTNPLVMTCLGLALSILIPVGETAALDAEMMVEPGETGWRSVRDGKPADLARITPVLVRLRRTTDAPWEIDPGTKLPGSNMPDTRPLIVVRVVTPKRSYTTRATFDK